MSKQLSTFCGYLIALCISGLGTVAADVETDGCSFAHFSPASSPSYSVGQSIPFKDSYLWKARRVAPIGSSDGITVICTDGYAVGINKFVVNQISKGKTWTGADITDWNDSANLNGTVTLAAGNYGYYSTIKRTILSGNGAGNAGWTNQLTGTSVPDISGGMTVQ